MSAYIVNKVRACVGCGMAPELGDIYCADCRSAVERGSDPADWPRP